ncbi:hypothetical protein [Chitinophaga arvensicola]|uniref:Uncharacterized protein n=1 Tax=Chitinophaga arvensicola TaxID=29529 RepID=A0A1I0PMZ5_9BACT|nr:hypothetical protein [Chitinophaga arvensicola]SEW15719.1 hypothetical protein SAMN04488122_0875 [Chitinophaga arvensicola]
MRHDTLSLLRQELAATGIMDERFINGLTDSPVADGMVHWMGRLVNDDKRLFYSPAIHQHNGWLDFHGVSATVVANLKNIDQNGASTDRLVKAIDDYYAVHYCTPCEYDLLADPVAGAKVLSEFSKLYDVDPATHFAYWAAHCYFDPPLTESAVRDFNDFKAQNVKFTFFPDKDRLDLSQIYALLAHPECPRPYFNRNPGENEPTWLQVDFHPTYAYDGATTLRYYPDYDIDKVLRTLNVEECNSQSTRNKVERTLRNGTSAIVRPVGSNQVDAIMLVADPQNKGMIALDLAQRRIELSTLLAPKEVIERRGSERRQIKSERVVNSKQGNSRKQMPG